MKYCIEGIDRVCHDEILFIGTEKECNKLVNTWFQHKKYGGIDACIRKYSKRHKKMKHNIHKYKNENISNRRHT